MALKCNKCYFTFGRFQPPTTGHAENFRNVKRLANGRDYRIYISHTHDNKGSNPLPPNRKLFWMNKMFPEHRGKIFSLAKADPVACLQDIMMSGYDEVVFLVGSDRVAAMQWVHKYNHKDFTFRTIDILSSGSRDADGDTFAISGTKMRRAAFAGDFKSFKVGVPNLGDADVKTLMGGIKINLPKNFK